MRCSPRAGWRRSTATVGTRVRSTGWRFAPASPRVRWSRSALLPLWWPPWWPRGRGLAAAPDSPTTHGSLRRPPDEAVTRGCAERAAVGCCRSTDEGGRDGRVRHGAGSAGGAEPTNPLLRGGTAPLAPRLHRLQPHVLPDPVRHLRGRVRRPAERCDRVGCVGRTVPGDLGARRVPVRATADVP